MQSNIRSAVSDATSNNVSQITKWNISGTIFILRLNRLSNYSDSCNPLTVLDIIFAVTDQNMNEPVSANRAEVTKYRDERNFVCIIMSMGRAENCLERSKTVSQFAVQESGLCGVQERERARERENLIRSKFFQFQYLLN
jgi:hypothetical protein